jgi:hypothetical protein
LSGVSKAERTLIEVRGAETSRRIVRGTDRLAWNADEIVIELVVAVEVFVNSDSIDSRREIGINAEELCVRRDRKKAVAERLIGVTRKSGW